MCVYLSVPYGCLSVCLFHMCVRLPVPSLSVCPIFVCSNLILEFLYLLPPKVKEKGTGGGLFVSQLYSLVFNVYS